MYKKKQTAALVMLCLRGVSHSYFIKPTGLAFIRRRRKNETKGWKKREEDTRGAEVHDSGVVLTNSDSNPGTAISTLVKKVLFQ